MRRVASTLPFLSSASWHSPTAGPPGVAVHTCVMDHAAPALSETVTTPPLLRGKAVS